MKTPVVYNVTCVLANTNYSQEFSENTVKVVMKTRNGAELKVGFTNFDPLTDDYWTLPEIAMEGHVAGTSEFSTGMTIYFQSPVAGTIVEFLAYIN